jgi:hypothetical protein
VGLEQWLGGWAGGLIFFEKQVFTANHLPPHRFFSLQPRRHTTINQRFG